MTGRQQLAVDDWSECPEGTMDYITDMLGTGFRDKMIATMGGMSIKVPANVSNLSDDHQLVCSLGRIDAEELVDTVPAATVYIPTSLPAAVKQDRVATMVRAGKNNNEIARALGISDRQVRRYRAKAGLSGVDLSQLLKVAPQKLAGSIASGRLALPAT